MISKFFKIIFISLFIAQTSANNILQSGNCLKATEQLTSTSGCFKFIFQTDGNAVIYQIGSNNELTAIFNTQTSGTGADSICMQTDGNLVVYAGTKPLFNTGTSGTTANHVVMQDDGNLVIYDSNNKYFWASNSIRNGVTCPVQTTTTARTTTLPEPSSQPGCDITKFLFDNQGNYLKIACWVKGPKDQASAVDYCRNIGMSLFVPSSAVDIAALAKTTIEIFGKAGYTSIWISGTKRIDTPWRDSNSGGQELFRSFSPKIVEYAAYNPAKCITLSSFGVDGYQLVTYDCYAIQSFWCQL